MKVVIRITRFGVDKLRNARRRQDGKDPTYPKLNDVTGEGAEESDVVWVPEKHL